MQRTYLAMLVKTQMHSRYERTKKEKYQQQQNKEITVYQATHGRTGPRRVKSRDQIITGIKPLHCADQHQWQDWGRD